MIDALGQFRFVAVSVFMVSETYRRDLTGQVDLLCQDQIALVQGAFEVNIGKLIAEIGLLPDQSNQTIFDLEQNVSTLLNRLLQCTTGLDRESMATAKD